MGLFWRLFAWVVSRRPIADYLIARSQRTPYFHLAGYMERFWLFNGYSSDQSLPPEERRKAKRFPWLPYSIRIHHILREDYARHLHDHPWNARTIILHGTYIESRLRRGSETLYENERVQIKRSRGDTATLKVGEYHSIDMVSIGGVWTMFIVGDFIEDWGFLVEGKKVNHELYEDGLEK